ncbi:S-layer homology domain-containing protein [Candidatus Peregrinibacteria bacterium]|nr:S-layer homology domain-containing protein [Candidatus Peregrinibacteria bacterium]
MKKAVKRVITSLTVFFITLFTLQVVFAGTFGDVVPGDWYYDAVEQLAVDGVFDAKDQFRPNDTVNRAELVKIVMLAIDGMRNFEAPEAPTFKDVPKDAWYYDYVEAAVSFDVIDGYADKNGNPTGYFGPGDKVTRSQAAKILVEAFAYPDNLNIIFSFADVNRGDWFYEYVTTAYNYHLFDGYGNGYFGPNDNITRAQMAKVTFQGMKEAEVRFSK